MTFFKHYWKKNKMNNAGRNFTVYVMRMLGKFKDFLSYHTTQRLVRFLVIREADKTDRARAMNNSWLEEYSKEMQDALSDTWKKEEEDE